MHLAPCTLHLNCTLFFDNEIYLLINVRIQMQFMIIIQTSCVLKHPETYQSSYLFGVLMAFLSALKFLCSSQQGILYHENTRKKGIGKMLYHLFLLIIVFVLSFATDARYMSPNFRPAPQRWLSSAPYFRLQPATQTIPALTTFNFLLLLLLPFST